MMGAGKSTLGGCLRRRTGLQLFDTDEIVSSRFGLSITEIFAKHGEEQFRDAEAEALRKLRVESEAIVVTGGGIVLREENVDLLQRLGKIVWLDADDETLFKRANQSGNRPLLQTENPRNTFAQMLQTRRPLYAKIADVRLDTSTLMGEEVAEKILNELPRSTIPATRNDRK